MCQVARKMDSFVSFPESWNSPGIRPVHLTGDASFVDSGGTDYYFVADEDIHINFSVRSSEPNDSLSAELPAGWDKNCLDYSAIAMTAGDKFNLCLSMPPKKPGILSGVQRARQESGGEIPDRISGKIRRRINQYMRRKNETGSKSRQEKGHVRIQDISFRYTATPYTADDRYKYRIYLRAIDPAGNSPIKKVPAAGEVRAAGNGKYISKEFYIKEKDAKNLLSIIKYEAQQLYNDNLNYFIDRLRIHSFSATSPVAFFQRLWQGLPYPLKYTKPYCHEAVLQPAERYVQSPGVQAHERIYQKGYCGTVQQNPGKG